MKKKELEELFNKFIDKKFCEVQNIKDYCKTVNIKKNQKCDKTAKMTSDLCQSMESFVLLCLCKDNKDGVLSLHIADLTSERFTTYLKSLISNERYLREYNDAFKKYLDDSYSIIKVKTTPDSIYTTKSDKAPMMSSNITFPVIRSLRNATISNYGYNATSVYDNNRNIDLSSSTKSTNYIPFFTIMIIPFIIFLGLLNVLFSRCKFNKDKHYRNNYIQSQQQFSLPLSLSSIEAHRFENIQSYNDQFPQLSYISEIELAQCERTGARPKKKF